MDSTIISIMGWIPAVILPVATLNQLVRIIMEKSAQGVSIATWLLFALANIALYIYTEKYFSVQSIVGLLGTGVIDIAIAVAAIKLRAEKKI